MKIIIQSKIALTKEDLEELEKEISKKLDMRVVVIKPSLDVATLKILE